MSLNRLGAWLESLPVVGERISIHVGPDEFAAMLGGVGITICLVNANSEIENAILVLEEVQTFIMEQTHRLWPEGSDGQTVPLIESDGNLVFIGYASGNVWVAKFRWS